MQPLRFLITVMRGVPGDNVWGRYCKNELYPKGFGDVKNSFPFQLRFRVERFFPQVSVCPELC
ncbi:Uncharacterised protein [Klebsiella oxytoca]|nr:Uncharacterised protein [Klebsiella oxytoca]